ncbi:SCF ubiquitin ligase [Suillus lakei]|nr:SCF ubiquitin ligase [Suillus lakei]
MVLLVTSDKEEVVECSMLLKTMLEDYRDPVQPKIPLPDVSSRVLKKVSEYCKYHKNDACPAARNHHETPKPIDINEWDQKSITADQDMLFEIILAANYLQITSLFDFGFQTVVNRTKGKTPEELCHFFGIINEFSVEEVCPVCFTLSQPASESDMSQT